MTFSWAQIRVMVIGVSILCRKVEGALKLAQNVIFLMKKYRFATLKKVYVTEPNTRTLSGGLRFLKFIFLSEATIMTTNPVHQNGS